MNIRNICMHCMSDQLNEYGECAACGKTEKEIKATPWRMPLRTILKGKYLIGKVIGEGGFGITYIGYDLDLEICVAIKEFCPKSYVSRDAADGITIYLFDESKEEVFEAERDKFINEARRLAKFRNQGGVVSIMDYFMENGTAYIVMDYIDGITLKSYLKTLRNTTGRSMNMAGVLNLFKPVMEALVKIHKAGIIHRDISPENIMISKDFTKAYLIDFGTARNMESDHTLSEYHKGFYTPIEQRTSQSKGKMEQGPWTDVYALCATIYLCITGRVMPDSVARMAEDDIIMPSKFGVTISPEMETVLMHGLAVKPQDRIQSVEELMKAFYRVQSLGENVTKKPEVGINVVTKTPKTAVNNVAQVTANSGRKKYINDEELEYEKRILRNEVERINQIGITFTVILVIAIFVSVVWLMVEGLSFWPIILLIFIAIGVKFCRDGVLAKKKSIFLDSQPNIGKVLLQIESMKNFLVFHETNTSGEFRRRCEVSYNDYKTNYSAHRNDITHSCHQFLESQEVDVNFLRYELIDYYQKTILTSDIPEELKVEWKQAAIDSWIMIENI